MSGHGFETGMAGVYTGSFCNFQGSSKLVYYLDVSILLVYRKRLARRRVSTRSVLRSWRHSLARRTPITTISRSLKLLQRLWLLKQLLRLRPKALTTCLEWRMTLRIMLTTKSSPSTRHVTARFAKHVMRLDRDRVP